MVKKKSAAERNAERAEKVKALTDKLEKGVSELFTSEKYQNYLKTMSKFHNYSPRNTLLIILQNPNASQVAGFNSWKKNFQRNVKKGEKGIARGDSVPPHPPFGVIYQKTKSDNDFLLVGKHL